MVYSRLPFLFIPFPVTPRRQTLYKTRKRADNVTYLLSPQMFNICQQLGNRLAVMEAVSREGTGERWGKVRGEDEPESVTDASKKSSEMTRKWLKGFKAEDILRDKSLLRQQLEVRGWFGFFPGGGGGAY